MTDVIWRTEGGDLLIEQRLSPGLLVARYGFGGVILAAGGYMALMMIEGPLSFFRTEGAGGLLTALPGFLVSALIAAVLVPLGGWICLTRKRWRLDGVHLELVEELDWRIRRARIRHSLTHYASVWVGLDALSATSDGPTTLVAQVRMLPRDRRTHPVIDLAFAERDQIERMKELAALISGRTGLATDVEAARTERRPAAPAGAQR